MAKKPFFITTAIPYVNSKPHIGHALEFVQADIIARWQKLSGREVFFLSGTDDNAMKNVQAAEAAGVPVADFVNRNSAIFKKMEEDLEVETNDFISTSVDPRHTKGAQKLWSVCKKEDIYKKKYRGFYCIGCEEFKTEKDLINGECPEHRGKKLEIVEEENYFFRLKNYQAKLKELISNNTISIIPETRRNETLAFIKNGLEDFSISRSAVRAKGWGISVPGDESQMMYVWFDALSNYINALGYDSNDALYKKFWADDGERVHCIGKGINRFHTIYWPAMLLSAGLSLPTKIFIHGYITADGEKMSKSIGNVVDPQSLIDEYGAEALRYFLAREISTFEDSPFTMERFKAAYNSGLANGLGNLVSRVMKMAATHLEKPIEIPPDTITEDFKNALNNFDIQKASSIVWKNIAEADAIIQEKAPFKLVKTDKATAQKIIQDLCIRLYTIGRMLNPIMPETSIVVKNLVKENKMPDKPLFARKD